MVHFTSQKFTLHISKYFQVFLFTFSICPLKYSAYILPVVGYDSFPFVAEIFLFRKISEIIVINFLKQIIFR